MRKVLFVSPTGAAINGAERAGLSLMGSLADAEFVVFNAFPTHYATHQPDRHDSYRTSMESMGVRPLPTDFGWWVPGDEEFGVRELTAVERLVSAIREHDIDVVATNTSNMPWGALAAALTDRPHVWLLHEFPTGVFAWLKDKYDFIAEFSSAVFCASPSLAEAIRAEIAGTAWDAPVHAFRPYSDVSAVTLAAAQEPRIVVVGSINRRKNQIEVVRSLPLLRDADIAPMLLFIGAVEDDAYRTEIEGLAAELGVSGQLAFLGHQEQPWSLVSPNDVIVQSSETEVFSLVASEAARLGLRLILSRNPSSLDIADDLGKLTLYDMGDVGALAASIERLLRDPGPTLDDASRIREVAVRALSAESCHAPILEHLTSSELELRRSSLFHLAPYVRAFLSGRDEELTTLEERIGDATALIEALEAKTTAQESANSLLEAELRNVYASKRWRLAQLLAAPATLLNARRATRRRRRG